MADKRQQRIDELKARIKAGETYLVDELAALLANKEPPTIRDGDPLRVKRSYTVTDAVLQANRENAQKSTGPVSADGKAITRRNSWKHGKYAQTRIIGLGKPCLSTCAQYPCDLVEEGKCEPGGDCLNRAFLVESCRAIEKALIDKNFTDLNDLMVMQLGETLQLVRELMASISTHGPVVEAARFDKDGNVIGYELKTHPSLLALPNLLKNLGISFSDFNLTPASQEKIKTDKEAAATLADIFRGAASGMAARRKDEA